MKRRLILCADDYALTSGISCAIRKLATEQRISATSAIVTGPAWSEDAAALKSHTTRLAVGMHLNLTLGRPLGPMPGFTTFGAFPGLATLVRRAYAGQLRVGITLAEISRQLDAFESAFSSPPDFIDGHQHVHVLPVVRAALLGELARRYNGRTLLVRDPSSRIVQWLQRGGGKALALSALAQGMRRDIETAGFMANDLFGGLSSFSISRTAVERDFADAARSTQTTMESRPLIMCHPGFADAELRSIDPVTTRRQVEFDVLMGSNPLSDCAWQPRRDVTGCVIWPWSGDSM